MREAVRGVGARPGGVEFICLSQHILGELRGWRILTVDLVAKAPGDYARVVAVLLDHLAQLLQAILLERPLKLRRHLLERFGAPRRHFELHQHAVAVAPVEQAAILHPMNSGEDAVEVLHVRVVVLNPIERFRHSVIRVAAGHAFDTHQTNRLVVELEAAVLHFEAADAEDLRDAVENRGILRDQSRFRPVKVGVIEMPVASALPESGQTFLPGQAHRLRHPGACEKLDGSTGLHLDNMKMHARFDAGIRKACADSKASDAASVRPSLD